MASNNYLLLIPLLPLLGAAFHLLIGRRIGKGLLVNLVAVGTVACSLGIAFSLVTGQLWELFWMWKAGGGVAPAIEQTVYTWIEVGSLKLDLAFRLDTMSAVMVLIITFVGLLIHIYSIGYMADDPRYATYFGYLNLFTGSMLILVLAANLPVMFIGWEGVGMCSYLLIGFWFDKEANANAGRKAFIVNRVGDFAFLLGMCLLFWETGTLTFSEFTEPAAVDAFGRSSFGGGSVALVAGILLFIGACGKSAQIPLYVWLPDAMAGPTPVSALIHAATMVTAGVYMIARLSFLYMSSTAAMAVVAGVGALTALFAAMMALAQTDLKKVLAYSTVSQLGFMFVGVGVGAYVAGIFHLLTHAFFKAGLFLGAGSIMHAMSGSGDISKMGGLRKKLPITHITFLIYCLAIAGIVPFSGFFSKDEILASAFFSDAPGWVSAYGKILWFVLSLAALGTAFYMFRLYHLVFSGSTCRADAETQAHIHESPASMTMPLAILAAFTCVLGVIGLPHLKIFEEMGIANLLGAWISPSVFPYSVSGVVASVSDAHHSGGAILALMGIAFAVAVVGILIATMIYRHGPSQSLEQRVAAGGTFAAIHRIAKDKFYVDELYEAVILQPFRWTAKVTFEFVDRFLIDILCVRGAAFAVDLLGGVARWFQNGRVQRYMVGMLAGSAVILHFAWSSPEVDFAYEEMTDTDGNPTGQVRFRPKVGRGPGAQGAKIEWFFSVYSDGSKADSTVAQPLHVFPSPNHYEVTMRWTAASVGEPIEVRKNIIVRGPRDLDGEIQ